MKFLAFSTLLASAVAAFPSQHLAGIARGTSNITLSNFIQASANGFFPAPGNDGWAEAFDEAFAPNVVAYFNDLGPMNFSQFKAYFAAVKANLELKYSGFEHSFVDVVAVSSGTNQTGGYAIITGHEGGLVQGQQLYGTDAAFGIVREIDGKLKFVEWHEITNLGAST